MGVVYRARDARLGRDVAVKVLPERFTDDAERLARFEREARLLASLNHPNIAQIYGLEAGGAARALVMELVEGPTLAERLAQGALPLDEALSVGLQIATALEEAHEKGIVHRDLKPANVKIAPGGKVKVLDFGLAKALDAASETAASLAQSPTITQGPTVAGVVLGTAAYMAPEQARGKPVDRRADLWAYGVILWECLAGRTLFQRGSAPETLAAILRDPPDLDALPSSTPAALRDLVRRCLVKDPRQRLQAIGDARVVIEELLRDPEALERGAPAPVERAGARGPASTATGARSAWPIAVAAAAGLAIGAAVVAWRLGAFTPPASRPEVSIVSLTSAGGNAWPVFSPDGRTVAFESDRSGERRIWIQDLRTGAESAVTGPASANPRYSPDGSAILFARLGEDEAGLRRVNVVGGEERRLVADASEGDWSPDGRSLVFLRPPGADSQEFRLGIVPAAGGAERIVASVQSQLLEPRWSSDGRTIAAVQAGLTAGVPDRILLVDVKTGAARSVGIARSDGALLRPKGLAWFDSRRLLVLAGDLEAAGYRASAGRLGLLDLDRGRLETLLPLPDVWRGVDVAADGRVAVVAGSASQNLAIEPLRPAPGSEPRWLTDGRYTDRQPVWSPDGASVLFSSDRSGNLDLWKVSIATGALARVTDDPADDWDPGWNPDGSKILFSSNRSGKFQIWTADADGSAPRQVTREENAQNPTMTADGRWIVYNSFDTDPKRRGLWKIHPDGSGAALLVAGATNVPDLSRDGRFVAYRGETAENETRIARVADGRDLGFALGDVARFRWLPGPHPTLALLRSREGTRRGATQAIKGYLDLVTIGPGDVAGSVRPLPPTAASREAETFDFSPDGRQVVFSTGRSVRSQIYLIDGLLSPPGR